MHEKQILDLFDKYSNMVYRLSYNYLGTKHDEEDATQGIFLKIIEGKAKPELEKEKAFLTCITINYCKDILKSSWNKKIIHLDESIELKQPEDQELLSEIMNLPVKYRVVVYLHYYEGYSFNEISKFLKIGSSTVSMRIYRARKILKDKLKENCYGA